MRWILAMTLVCLVSFSPAQAQSNAEIEATISKQIDAFRNNDIDTAFSFASPGLRQMFGNAQNFGTMVQQGYPMVWRPSAFQFETLRVEGAQYFQRILITDAAGVQHLLEYALSQTSDGWHINSVVILEAPQVGV